MIIQFQNLPVFLRSLNQCLIINLISPVIRMSDNVYIWILHHIQIGFCVLKLRCRLHTRRMQTRNNHVHTGKRMLSQIHCSLRIQNIYLRSQQQLNPVHLPWHNLKIIKIKLMTRPRHTRRMLRNPQNLQSLLGSCLRHLPQRTISMPTGHSMRMQIQHRIISHNKPLLISYNIPLHYTTILPPPQANFPSTHFYHPFLLKPTPKKIASSQRRKIVC